MKPQEMGDVLTGLSLMLPKYAPKEISMKLCVMWLRALSDFSDEQLHKAFAYAAQNLTEFPAAATIKRICLGSILSDEETGIETAAKIEAAIWRYGPISPGTHMKDIEEHMDKVRTHVGDIGIEVIGTLGGWNKLAKRDGEVSMSLRKVMQTVCIIAARKKFQSGKESIKALEDARVIGGKLLLKRVN